MFRFNYHHQGACYLSFVKVTVTIISFIPTHAQVCMSWNKINNSNNMHGATIKKLLLLK